MRYIMVDLSFANYTLTKKKCIEVSEALRIAAENFSQDFSVSHNLPYNEIGDIAFDVYWLFSYGTKEERHEYGKPDALLCLLMAAEFIESFIDER